MKSVGMRKSAAGVTLCLAASLVAGTAGAPSLAASATDVVKAPATNSKPKPPMCLGKRATIVAKKGAIIIKGTRRADVIVANGKGNDVKAGGGNDRICGLGDRGPDKDFLNGGAGNDLISGGAGEDAIQGESGQDQVWGGADTDELFGNEGEDLLIGGAGNDKLFGFDGTDRLEGGDGADQLRGDDANDALFGGAGPDLLDGGTEDVDYCDGDTQSMTGDGASDSGASCESQVDIP